jgi:hypothetical protein
MTLRAIAKESSITSTLRFRGDSIGDRPIAPNHIFGLGDGVPTVTATLVAILVCALPVYAQNQKPDIAKLKVDAQNAFSIISSDKLKIQTFCEMADLGNQLDQADRVHDTKKTEEISQKLDELERKLPEYTALVDGLKDVDPNSQDAQEIGSIILKLDDLCD